MRLQEPVNGIKIAVGHVIIHLCFFMCQCILDQDIEKNLNYDAKKDYGYEAAAAHRMMAAAAAEVEVKDPMEVK